MEKYIKYKQKYTLNKLQQGGAYDLDVCITKILAENSFDSKYNNKYYRFMCLIALIINKIAKYVETNSNLEIQLENYNKITDQLQGKQHKYKTMFRIVQKLARMLKESADIKLIFSTFCDNNDITNIQTKSLADHNNVLKLTNLNVEKFIFILKYFLNHIKDSLRYTVLLKINTYSINVLYTVHEILRTIPNILLTKLVSTWRKDSLYQGVNTSFKFVNNKFNINDVEYEFDLTFELQFHTPISYIVKNALVTHHTYENFQNMCEFSKFERNKYNSGDECYRLGTILKQLAEVTKIPSDIWLLKDMEIKNGTFTLSQYENILLVALGQTVYDEIMLKYTTRLSLPAHVSITPPEPAPTASPEIKSKENELLKQLSEEDLKDKEYLPPKVTFNLARITYEKNYYNEVIEVIRAIYNKDAMENILDIIINKFLQQIIDLSRLTEFIKYYRNEHALHNGYVILDDSILDIKNDLKKVEYIKFCLQNVRTRICFIYYLCSFSLKEQPIFKSLVGLKDTCFKGNFYGVDVDKLCVDTSLMYKNPYRKFKQLSEQKNQYCIKLTEAHLIEPLSLDEKKNNIQKENEPFVSHGNIVTLLNEHKLPNSLGIYGAGTSGHSLYVLLGINFVLHYINPLQFPETYKVILGSILLWIFPFYHHSDRELLLPFLFLYYGKDRSTSPFLTDMYNIIIGLHSAYTNVDDFRTVLQSMRTTLTINVPLANTEADRLKALLPYNSQSLKQLYDENNLENLNNLEICSNLALHKIAFIGLIKSLRSSAQQILPSIEKIQDCANSAKVSVGFMDIISKMI